MNKKDIKSMSLHELEEYFVMIGQKPYRAKQVFSWLHNGITDFARMTNISSALIDKLDSEFYISGAGLVDKLESSHDGTIKFLWKMTDGSVVESVVMSYEHGNTVCISSQVGCKMGCAFCASAIGGFYRNLSAGEMIDQVIFSQISSGLKISNIVIMGIGEPLDNFDNLLRFLELINHPDGMNIGARRISISTCGIVENIDKLADNRVQSTLSVSLHAPDDETRSKLMPINRRYSVDILLEACRNYFSKTGRRVSFEYALIDGINDTSFHAELLAKKLRKTASHVNIIPLSNVLERSFRGSSDEKVKAFTKILHKCGVNATVRRSMGLDITASCGQLRVRHKDKG